MKPPLAAAYHQKVFDVFQAILVNFSEEELTKILGYLSNGAAPTFKMAGGPVYTRFEQKIAEAMTNHKERIAGQMLVLGQAISKNLDDCYREIFQSVFGQTIILDPK